MAKLFNDFMMEYKDIGNLTEQERLNFHIDKTNSYAIKAIELIMKYIDDEKVQKDFSKWLHKRGINKKAVIL